MADIKKLFLSHPESEKISKIFIPDKPSTGNKEIGDIFVVLNCDEDENNKLFVRFLKDKIEEYYINTSEKSIKSNSDKKNVGNIFENFLFSLNRDFQKLKKDNEILINTSKLNLLIGVLYNDKKNERSYVYFSQIGKIESLLIYETSEDNPNIAQIKESDDDKKASVTKIFSNVISGEVKEGNSIIFCTSNILDYIPLDKIKDLGTGETASKISEGVKKILVEIDEVESFCAIAIKIKNKKTTKSIGANNSVNKKSEKKEERDKKRKRENTASNDKTEISKIDRDYSSVNKKKIEYKKIFKKIFSFIRLPMPIRGLPILSKVILICGIILTILFVQSIGYIKYKKAKDEKIRYYQSLLTKIEEKKDELEASLIYNSKDKASSILINIEELIKKLPQESQDQKEKLIEIKEQIKELTFKTKSIIEITDIKELADYSKITESTIKSIIIKDGTIYSITKDNSFFELNTSDLSIKKTEHQSINLQEPISLLDNDSSIIVLHKNNSLSKLTLDDKKISPIKIEFPKNNTNISIASTYGDNLYSVDTENNQIYKHSPSADDFSIGKPWLKEDLQLQKTKSITIDGAIYTINSDGIINKIFRGKKQEFNFKNENELISGPEKIWTNTELSNLYIMDAMGKKIAIIDKDGKLITQYYSEKFTDLRDFIVLNDGKKIYVLSNNKIFEIDTENLK